MREALTSINPVYAQTGTATDAAGLVPAAPVRVGPMALPPTVFPADPPRIPNRAQAGVFPRQPGRVWQGIMGHVSRQRTTLDRATGETVPTGSEAWASPPLPETGRIIPRMVEAGE